MDQSSTGAYISIIEHILEANKDILDTSQINMGIARASSEGSPLEGVEINDDLTVEYSALEKDPARCKEAVGEVIRIIYDFVSVIMDPDTAEDDVLKPAAAYARSKGLDDALESLSDLIGGESETAVMSDKTDIEKLAIIYKSCIDSYLKESKRDYSQHLRNLFASIAKVEVTNNECTVQPAEMEYIGAKLAESFNEFVELYFSLEGRDMDLAEEEKRIRALLDPFGSLPRDLGVTNNILFGSLAPTVTTGLAILDNILGGGIPRGESAVLRVPPGWASEVFTRKFIRSGLVSGASAVVILSSIGPKDFYRQMEMMGLDTERYEKRGKLRIIDWYSHNYERVIGIEKKGNVTRCSNDLTNLNIALDMVMNELDDSPLKLGLVDVVTPAMLKFGFQPVYELVQAINSKFKKLNVSGIVSLVRGVHKMEYFHSISDIFSTTIDMEKVEGRTGEDLYVTGYSVSSSTRERLVFSWTKRGVVVEGKGDVETVPLTYEKDNIDLDIPGMKMIGMGIFPGKAAVLMAPECPEKDLFLSSFIKEGFKNKKTIIVLGNMTPEDFMNTQNIDDIPEGVIFVDWYSHKSEKIIGVEKRDNVYLSSQDIAHLAIALRRAVEEAGDGAFVALDVLTSLLKYYELPAVASFTMSVIGVLRENNATSLFTLDDEAFDKEYAGSFAYLMDETIKIKEDRNFDGEKFIWIPSIRNGFTTTNKAVCMVEEEGLTLKALEDFMHGEKGAMKGEISQSILDSLTKENSQLKRELTSMEETIDVNSEARNHARILELETEVSRLKEELFTDATDLAAILTRIDELFVSLPPEVLETFTSSKIFPLYEKIVDKYALSRDYEG